METDPVRRHALRAAASALLLAASAAPAALAALQSTPRQTRGPFYPVQLPDDHDADLVRVAGRGDGARGEVCWLHGRVLDLAGRPLPDAVVEIWQCDAGGVYHHPRDRPEAARDAGFQGYGRVRSDRKGRYRFRTIKPVPYPGRTPHIHVQVSLASGAQLASQIYIRDHPGNARDFLYSRLDADQRARAQATFETAARDDARWQARFDVVMPDA